MEAMFFDCVSGWLWDLVAKVVGGVLMDVVQDDIENKLSQEQMCDPQHLINWVEDVFYAWSDIDDAVFEARSRLLGTRLPSKFASGMFQSLRLV